MIAQTSAVRPAIESTAPTGSSGRAWGSRDSGMSRMPAAIATAAIGTLIQNTALQSNASSSAPPATGPSTMPMPDTAAQAPIARPRSSAGKIAVMIESVEGMMNAPPTPISARVAVSISLLVASAEAAEPTAKTTSPN